MYVIYIVRNAFIFKTSVRKMWISFQHLQKSENLRFYRATEEARHFGLSLRCVKIIADKLLSIEDTS